MSNYLDFKLSIVEMDDIVSSPNLLDRLRELTLMPSSGMNCALTLYSHMYNANGKSIDALAILAKVPNNNIIGWSLFTYESDGLNFLPAKNNVCSHTYVHPEYRKYGVGGKLFLKAIDLAGNNTIR